MREKEAHLQEIFTLQSEVHVLFDRVLEPLLGAEGITVPQGIVLKILREQDHVCKMSDLAAIQFQTPAAATGIVDRLIHLGLVQRNFDEKDRRVVLLALTARGKATLAAVERKTRQILLGFLQSVPDSEVAASLHTFRKLKEYLKEEVNAQKRKVRAGP
jgi:DNA-binding MarR family transcriptional regulator